MKSLIRKVIFVCFFATSVFTFGQSKDMYIILLAGQSNMAGRGVSRIPDDTISYPNIYSLNKDSVWVRAKNPLHWDKAEAAVGMGITFAHELAVKLGGNVKIGLVPCAAGGTTIDQWLSNSYFAYTGNFYLYDNFIKRAKKASKSGVVVGMIWHQGESDATTLLYSTYQTKLNSLFQKIRTDLCMPTLPIVAGEIGTFLATNTACPRWDSINVAINNVKKSLANYDVVSSIGLTPNADNTHLTSESQVILGSRYATSFFNIASFPTLGKMESTISVNGQSSYTYDGNPKGPSNATVQGSTGAVTYSYLGVNGTTYPVSSFAPSGVGYYSVTATVAEDANFYTVTSAPFTFSILSQVQNNLIPTCFGFPGTITGVNSEQNKWGWAYSGPNSSPVWKQANDLTSGTVRFRDLTASAISNGGFYEGRESILRWDGSYNYLSTATPTTGGVYSLGIGNGTSTVASGIPLIGGASYTFSGYAEWVNSGTAPTFSVQFSRTQFTSGTNMGTFSLSWCSAVNNNVIKYLPFSLTFTPLVTADYFIQFTQTGGLSSSGLVTNAVGGILGLANLSLVKNIATEGVDLQDDKKVFCKVTKRIIEVKGENTQSIKLMNLVGELLFYQEVKTEILTINMEQYPAGVYIVETTMSTGKKVFQKLLIR